MTLVDGTGLWCEIAGTECAGRSADFSGSGRCDRGGGRLFGAAARPADDCGLCSRRLRAAIDWEYRSSWFLINPAWDAAIMAGAILRQCRRRLPLRWRKSAHISMRFWPARIMPMREESIASPIIRGANRIPGMLWEAGKRMQLDLANSWIIGDRATDLAAGRAASLRNGILVATGYGQKEREAALALVDQNFAVETSPDLGAAVEVLILRMREVRMLMREVARGLRWRAPARAIGRLSPGNDAPQRGIRRTCWRGPKIAPLAVGCCLSALVAGWRRSCGRGVARADRF